VRVNAVVASVPPSAVYQGNEQLLIGLFVWQQLTLQPLQQRAYRGGVAVAGRQGVGHRPDLLDQWQHGVVLDPQPQRSGDVSRGHRDRVDRAGQHSPRGKDDRQHVNDLLHDRARRRPEKPERRDDHCDERQAHADQDGLSASTRSSPGRLPAASSSTCGLIERLQRMGSARRRPSAVGRTHGAGRRGP
jgi:hypothetical protein